MTYLGIKTRGYGQVCDVGASQESETQATSRRSQQLATSWRNNGGVFLEENLTLSRH